MKKNRIVSIFLSCIISGCFTTLIASGETGKIFFNDENWILAPLPISGSDKPAPPAKLSASSLASISRDALSISIKQDGTPFNIFWKNKISVPNRIEYDFLGYGVVSIFGIQLNTFKHWQQDIGMLALYAYDKKQNSSNNGYYRVSVPIEYPPAPWYHVKIENYSDYSKAEISNKETGEILMSYKYISRNNLKEISLELARISKVKYNVEMQFANFSVETGISEKSNTADAAPAGHHLLFGDDFKGKASKWGSVLYLPGCMTLFQKTYFKFSYPVIIPDLVFSDGIIDAELLFQPKSKVEICLRTNTFGDAYYAFRFGAGCKGEIVKSELYGKEPQVIGKSKGLKGKAGKIVKVRFQANGDKLTAFIDGQEAASAVDSSYTKGGIAFNGHFNASVQINNLEVFTKDGSECSWRQPSEDGTIAKSREKRPLPETKFTGNEREFRDADGRTHKYILEKGILYYDGLPFIPVKNSDGQYFLLYEPDSWTKKAWDKIRCEKTISDIEKYGLNYPVVRLRLSDFVDCTLKDHAFNEDNGLAGRSRIININGEDYRVTDCRRTPPPFFCYTFNFTSLNEAHVIAYQVPNDRDRFLSVNPIPSESGSGGVYTGGNYPVDGKSYIQMHVYYPPKEKIELIFMHAVVSGVAQKRIGWTKDAGAAVSGVWAMEILDPLASVRPVVLQPEGAYRSIGAFEQQAGFIFKIYGVSAERKDKSGEMRGKAFASWLDYLQFTGSNTADMNWFGVDWIIDGVTVDNLTYDSSIFASYRKYFEDRITEFLPELDKRKMMTYPSLASFNINDSEKAKFGFDEDDFLVKRNGEMIRIFSQLKLDPTSEKVKNLFVKTVDELAGKVAGSPGVKGIGISIDGFFTLADDVGYGKNSLARFEKKTGIKVPGTSADEAYFWVHETPERIEKWNKWRCDEMMGLLIRLRDTIRKYRPDWNLIVRVLNLRTYKFVKSTDAEALEILTGQGINPELYRDVDGIIFITRSCYEHKALNVKGDAGYNFTHGIADISTRSGTGYHQWTGYWEQAGVFNSLSRYSSVGWLSSATMVPCGRNILETATYHLRVGNIRILEYQTWERGTGSWEHYMRRFAAAFRSLPVCEPVPFKGNVEVLSGPVSDETLYLAWFGDRLAIVNDNPNSRTISIEAAGNFMELGRLRVLKAENGRIKLELEPHDLLVFTKSYN